MALTDTLVEINKLQKLLDELQPLSKQDKDRLWQKFRLEWNYNSNHIEGNTLTYGETVLLIMNDKTTGDHELREYEEMKAHDLAIHTVRQWAEERDRQLSEKDIRDLNKIILKEPFFSEAETSDGTKTTKKIIPGQYKELPNSVRTKTGEIFHYASPEETPALMTDLIDWYRKSNLLHPLNLAAELHYRFIRIHPFDDGNGRVARLLVNYVLMGYGFPPIIVKSADKDNYLTALQKADAGDLSAFSEYMAQQLIWSLEKSIAAARGEKIEDSDDLDKRISLISKDLESFGDKDSVQIVKDKEVMWDLLHSVIKPLCKIIHDKLLKVTPWFADAYFVHYIDGGGAEHHNINDWLEDIESSWRSLYDENRFPNSFRIECRLNKLKKLGINAFDVRKALDLKFDDHSYCIKEDRNVIKEKLYHQKLSEIEMNAIADDFLKEMVDEIEKRINETKK